MLNFTTMDADKSREIVEIITHDSRTTAESIAAMISSTTDEVKAELERLERAGIIKQYSAIVDWEKIGVEKVVAFVDVKVTPARDVGFDSVAMRVARHPEVKSSWLVSGGHDLRLIVESRHLKDLANFVAEKIATIDGVTGTNTTFLLRTYKEEHVLFQELEPDNRLVVSP